MSKLILVLSALSVISATSFATESTKTKSKPVSAKRKPTQIEITRLRFKVVYGDRLSNFEIRKTVNGASFEFWNNNNKRKTRDLTADDFLYLTQKIDKIGESNKIEFCPRGYIRVRTETKNKIGCLSSPSATARKLQALVNLLTVYSQ